MEHERTSDGVAPERRASLYAARKVRDAVVVVLEVPGSADGEAMWRLAGEANLDQNAPYAYLLFADYFRDTCIVARDEADGSLAGFVLGFLEPRDPSALFVWQVAVAPRYRGAGIATRMLVGLLERRAGEEGSPPRHMTATVTPSNQASMRTFRKVATTLGAGCAENEGGFAALLFPAETPHEEECLLRIGPIERAATEREP
jgi:L-2,4-diaminobutyric acid acetyltransferase